jgi:hypothetical protein
VGFREDSRGGVKFSGIKPEGGWYIVFSGAVRPGGSRDCHKFLNPYG